MGGSHSSHHRLEDDEGSEQDADSQYEAMDVAPADISPVISDEGESARLLRPSSSSVLHGAFQNADTNPWNMFQNHVPFMDTARHGLEDSPFRSASNNAQEAWDDVGWQAVVDDADETTLQDFALATCSFLSIEVTGAILGEDWDDGPDSDFLESSATGVSFSDYSRSTAGIFRPWISPGVLEASRHVTDVEGNMTLTDFHPPLSQNHEWMGRSIETLMLGLGAVAPVLALPEEEDAEPTNSKSEGGCTRRTSVCSLDVERSPHRAARRSSLSRGANYRRRNRGLLTRNENASNAGPNVLLSLLAREGTGKPASLQSVPPTRRLREMGGSSLYDAVDKPSGGIVSEVFALEDALNRGDWVETQTIISRLAPRLIGDPTLTSADRARNSIDDPSLPASASKYHAGGGRLGLERDSFVLSGGVKLLLRVFTEPAFVGDELVRSNDARDLSEEIVNKKLVGCWSELFVSLRELIYAMPVLVENGEVLDGGDFLPFLFTVLAHDSCFDGAAALIEEILSVQSQSLQLWLPLDDATIETGEASRSVGYAVPASTFFLGNVPDLYELWDGFNCRQLAHFCRLLALLIFEPEDRQVLESPAVLKSVELLQLRRDRAARAGRDATVDMNHAVLLGDLDLLKKLLKLLRVMNFGPSLTRSTPYQVMAHFPFIGDTLPLVGLIEISAWNDIDRLENLARTMLSQEGEDRESEERLSDLGSIADMLESLSGLLHRNALEPMNQLGHIIQVIIAAQQAGIIVGMPSQSRPRSRHGSDQERPPNRSPQATSSVSENLAAAAMTISDQILLRRLRADENASVAAEGAVQVVGLSVEGATGDPAINQVHVRVNSPMDAANELQFNSFLLAPFQVEVLFVLCTLLGGRRKLDAQTLLTECGLIPILDEMFHRLSFGSPGRNSSPVQPSAGESTENGDADTSSRFHGTSSGLQSQEEPHGIHGPGCECTPESALSVQFLRVLHNFCDRDCDNHTDRRLLLSTTEREFVFSSDGLHVLPRGLQPGLLSNVITAFLSEPDDSPYRFWLASCIESYLRGSCVQEQFFIAQSGLLLHLVGHVTSDRLHCAGSLQTSFDLLGEMCKGNLEVVRLLMSRLDESSFHKLMNVAASNLVDSNVFIRSLVLSVERIAMPQPRNQDDNGNGAASSQAIWQNKAGPSARFYLTHSWWDPVPFVRRPSPEAIRPSRVHFTTRHADTRSSHAVNDEQSCEDARPSDWYPPAGLCCFANESPTAATATYAFDSHVRASADPCGWVLSPDPGETHANTIGRLRWVLDVNRARLVWDLLAMVDLRNINHENICCLNTAVVLVIFAHRRNNLRQLLQEFMRIGGDNKLERQDNVDCDDVDGAFIEAIQSLDLTGGKPLESLEPSLSRNVQRASSVRTERDAARNFRELIWFWTEYYSHRGRDRLSLEFSSHLRFQEWKNVVSVLGADDGSSTSLCAKPVRLPRSPYQRAPRILDLESHLRGA